MASAWIDQVNAATSRARQCFVGGGVIRRCRIIANEPLHFVPGNGTAHRAHAELIAEAEQAFTAAKRLVDEQTAIVWRLERTGSCNSEAVDLLNNLRELLAARERRLARVLSWPSWDTAA